jgi:predicted O-linked N-acetylglucosamine transferase (SPINDLY family)
MKLLLICGPWGSGTTAVAGLMASLGAQGFGPYFHTNDPRTPVSYEFIPFRDAILDHACEETVALKPGAAEAAQAGLRRLGRRIEQQEFGAYDPDEAAAPIFLKYPLSALLLPQICAVFDTRLIYVMRPLEEIERTRLRRNWVPQYGTAGAEIIYRHMASFQRLQSHPIFVIDYADMLAAPAASAGGLADFAGLAPGPDAIEEAVAFIRSGQGAGAEPGAGDDAPRAALSADRHFRRAVSLHEKERLAEAEGEYRLALAAAPEHFDSLGHLGLLCVQQSRLDEAEALLRRAVAANPASPDATNHLGSLLQARQRHEEALAYHRQAIALDPDYCESHYDLGTALLTLNRPEEAAASFRNALVIDPEWPEVHFNLAVALQALGRADEAIACYGKATALKPDYVKAHGGLGAALMARGRAGKALASFDRVLALDPRLAEAHHGRGSALARLQRHDQALASFDQAIALKPDYAEAFNNRGSALLELFRHDQAVASFDKAIALKPDYAEAFNNRGIALAELQRLDDALASYRDAVHAKPDHAHAAVQIILLRRRMCEWRDYAVQEEELHAIVRRAERIPPFVLLAAATSPAEQLAAARRWAAGLDPPAAEPMPNAGPRAHEKIRIGYLSADFSNHATAFLTAELFERHDRSRFDIYGYSYGPDDRSAMRGRLVAAFDHFVELHHTGSGDAAQRIRRDEIDILVDLKGYTQNARTEIMLHRPAPIQVNYLGYPGTMGTDCIDYIIADRWIIPPDQHDDYDEKILCLPDSYQVNDRKRRIGAHPPSRAAAGLPEGGFVFCSFNNNYKITPAVFDVWINLLRQVDGSVLWLIADNQAVVRNLRREAEARGIPGSRLVFAPRMTLEDHLARHRLADLFLDTLPCNAHTTASDALWAGLPLVTCLGTTFAGRVAASLLAATGLEELITHSLADYEALALRLARDRAALGEIRATLARRRDTCALFDTDRFRRHLETAFLAMWERHRRGESPSDLCIAPDGVS